MRVNKSSFVHLHVHTQYSLLDGAIRVVDLFKKAKDCNMQAVAITDHGTMFGVLDFYNQGVKAGIKPIIGCEFYVAPRTIDDRTPEDRARLNHLVLLAENRQGYENLCQLASIAQLKGFYYKPRIDYDLLTRYHKGLICLSACLKGKIPQYILNGSIDKAEETVMSYSKLFGENNFFLELQKNGIQIQEKVNDALIEMSVRHGIPLVATNDAHYLNSDDAKAHELLLCIQTHKKISDPDRFTFESDQLYFKSSEEMNTHFETLSEVLDNTIMISNRCDLDLTFTKYHFPIYNSEAIKSVEKIFEEQVYAGYLNRLEAVKVARGKQFNFSVYDQRIKYEIETIKTMGFCGYFLIVADFIRYAKDNKIPVGPGRGSAAGSLVSYSLNITDLDPILHGLIFERFLNPGRVSMPDIDVDFCVNGRERVYDYVVKRYGGSDYVAQIITFGTMKARMVIRDVGKALGFSLNEVDIIAKLIPEGVGVTIDVALKEEQKLREKIESDSKYIELIKISKALEGLLRHASTHAAGVVISDRPLVKYLPLYKGKKNETVTQFDMKSVEDIGLVKFDFLGLRNLTVMDETLKIIKWQEQIVPNLVSLQLDDFETYKLLQRGDTIGVFQLESSGMKNLMRKLKPEKFDEIIALVALYRPGPLDSGMVVDFVERKHGRQKVEYAIAALEPILRETYGVIVYQEQVMEIAVELAGYSMSDADSLRKAIGKKISSLMALHREKFIIGAVKKDITLDKATELFDLIEKFGGYGFNKSHSAAYALIAYQTAYLKAHYPVEFMAAFLTSETDNIDGIVKFIDECKLSGIKVLPPDINESEKYFMVKNSKITFGLAAIKNVGITAVDTIIKDRQERGFFKSIFDFCQRVDLGKVNKRVVESLIYCGAFDSTNIGRSKLIAVLEDVLEYGQSFQKEMNSRQMTLFNVSNRKYINLNQPIIPNTPDWTIKSRLEFEKESVGFYFSGHPLDDHKDFFKKTTTDNSLSLKSRKDKIPVRIGGTIDTLKIVRTKKNALMSFVTLGDMYGKVEVVIFPSIYLKYSDYLVQDELLLVKGETKIERGNVKIIANSISDRENVESNWPFVLRVMMNSELTNKEDLIKVYRILKQYPGSSSVFIHLIIKNKGEVKISISDNIKVKSCEDMISKVNAILGNNAVKTEYL